MTARATLAAVVLWFVVGAGIEMNGRHERAMSIAQANLAKAARFVDGCLRGEVAPIDDLLYDCSKIRKLDTPARLMSAEMDEADRLWRACATSARPQCSTAREDK